MTKKDIKALIYIVSVFFLFYFVDLDTVTISEAILAGLTMLNEYSREHVLTCLVPAFFIAGAISIFVKKDYIFKYLGAKVKKYISYSIASISGAILAVCSCTVLPLFAGIYKRGAGLGPAITFLFSGPAINIAAIFLTFSVLGFKLGLARIIAAIVMAILVGISMHFLFKEKNKQAGMNLNSDIDTKDDYKSSLILIFILTMVAILVVNGLSISIFVKYILMAVLAISTFVISNFFFKKETNKSWLKETWYFAKLLLPLLFVGVFVAGFVMPFLPEDFIVKVVGNNSMGANILASVFGAFMYFSTLTEIPILQALISKGMNSGPALALLLAGPSLSFPNLLVIRKVLGNKKTIVYVLLVLMFSSLSGFILGGII